MLQFKNEAEAAAALREWNPDADVSSLEAHNTTEDVGRSTARNTPTVSTKPVLTEKEELKALQKKVDEENRQANLRAMETIKMMEKADKPVREEKLDTQPSLKRRVFDFIWVACGIPVIILAYLIVDRSVAGGTWGGQEFIIFIFASGFFTPIIMFFVRMYMSVLFHVILPGKME